MDPLQIKLRELSLLLFAFIQVSSLVLFQSGTHAINLIQ